MWTQFAIFNDASTAVGANRNPFQVDEDRVREFLAVLNDCKMEARQVSKYKNVLAVFLENLTKSDIRIFRCPKLAASIG